MHAAKSRGKGRFVVYDGAMHSGVLERLELKGDLARAVENNELLLYYQPIVSLRTRRITGFEALMRWRHPERGVVSPGSFIPLAEETGLIIPMGSWLLDAAFSQLAKWRTDHDVTMSVNLSPRQLDAPSIVDDIASRLVAHGIDPSWVTIELTETGLVDGGSINHTRLEAIRALGVKVAADDFGSGYASYAALGQLPYTGVKIDMSLVQALEGAGSEKAQAQVRSLCEMAKALGLTVVAEGVEAGEQASLLITLGCDFAQGYYFSPAGARRGRRPSRRTRPSGAETPVELPPAPRSVGASPHWVDFRSESPVGCRPPGGADMQGGSLRARTTLPQPRSGCDDLVSLLLTSRRLRTHAPVSASTAGATIASTT